MSQPSAGPGDVEAPPAEEKNVEHQVQPQGQAVGQQLPDAGDRQAPGAAADRERAGGESAGGEPARSEPVGDESAGGGEGPTDAGGTAGGVEQPSTTAPAPSDADPITGEMEELRSKLDDARRQKVEAESEFSDLDNRLKTLETVQKDADATVTAYASAYDLLAGEEKAYTEYLAREKDSLAKSLGEKVGRVEDAVDASRATGEKLERKVETATDKLAAAERRRDELKVQVKERGDILNGWKKLAAALAGQHTELKKMRDDVTKARQAGHYGLAYYLLQRAERRRKELVDKGPSLTAPAEVRGALLTAVRALADVEKAFADAERKVATRKERLATATKKRDHHKTTAEAALREDLVKVTKGDAVTTGGTDHA